MYYAADLATPVCCTKHCAPCAVPDLTPGLFGDHM